jgi:hypothetical protein
MPHLLPVALCAFAMLSGCAAHAPVAGKVPPASVPIAVGQSNRFEMTQHGRQMSAGDFDAWMKARGIRIAKGARIASVDKPKPKSKPKVQTKAK